MQFDDRLATVLRQRAAGGSIVRIQYRQLLDLLGTIPHETQGAQVDAAYARLAELSRDIPAQERAAILSEPWMRLRSPRLISVLADNEPPVAAAAIARAQLSEEEWLDLAPALPIKSRGFMRSRDDLGPAVDRLKTRMGIVGRGLPLADFSAEDLAVETAPGTDAPHDEVRAELPPAHPRRSELERVQGIGAIVRRIEEFRKARQLMEGAVPSLDSPRLPLGEMAQDVPANLLRSVDFSTDNEGRITWSTPSAAPMLVGLRITADDAGGTFGASPGFVAGLRRQQPLRQEHVSIIAAPAVSGEWLIDASPRFDRASGRFIGYIGRMRRPTPEAPVSPAVPVASEADRMRQLLHELRTPVNAIQGFAEVIQQQLFGPTPHEYRALAAGIVGDAARILSGFEDLDRLAKLEAGAMHLDPGSVDIALLLTETVKRIEPFSAPRGSGFVMGIEDEPLLVAMDRRDAERLIWRVLATLAASTAPSEMLKLRARTLNGTARLSIQLPAALAARSDAELFTPSVPAASQALSAGIFGGGFALRLSASEAQSLGGRLQRIEDRLRLILPLAGPGALTADRPGQHNEALDG